MKTLFIAKGSPWENGYVESFNGKLRDELLNREIVLELGGSSLGDRPLAARLQSPPHRTVHWTTRPPPRMRPAVFFRLRLRLSASEHSRVT